jgi:hypothetical protein
MARVVISPVLIRIMVIICGMLAYSLMEVPQA